MTTTAFAERINRSSTALVGSFPTAQQPRRSSSARSSSAQPVPGRLSFDRPSSSRYTAARSSVSRESSNFDIGSTAPAPGAARARSCAVGSPPRSTSASDLALGAAHRASNSRASNSRASNSRASNSRGQRSSRPRHRMERDGNRRPQGLLASAILILSLLGLASVASADWSPGTTQPSPKPAVRYVVQPGDTLTSIVANHVGRRDGGLVDDLAQAHGSWSVQIGDVLWLPSAS
jgi:LysM repeat protein